MENLLHTIAIGNVAMHKFKFRIFAQERQPRILQPFVIKLIEIIQAQNFVAHLKKPLRNMKTNKPRTSSEEDSIHTREAY